MIRALLILSLCLSLLTYNLWPLLPAGSFYKGMAVFIMLLGIIINNLVSDSIKIWSSVLLWLSINNVLDEFFFNPKKFGINEYIISIVIVASLTLQYYNGKRKRNTSIIN